MEPCWPVARGFTAGMWELLELELLMRPHHPGRHPSILSLVAPDGAACNAALRAVAAQVAAKHPA